MQKNGSFNREKSSTLAFVTVTSFGVLACEGNPTTLDPFMLPLRSTELSGVVGLHWPTSWWASQAFKSLKTSLVSSGFTGWSWSPLVHCPPWLSVSPRRAGGRDGMERDLEIPLDKWEEPLKHLLLYSFSEELLRETEGLFWMGEDGGFDIGFTLMGLRSIPDATRFSMRPPSISIAPAGSRDRSGPKMSPYTAFPSLCIQYFTVCNK